jgi:TetR/AcrR family transcriptional repressor of nem operon
MSEQIQPGRRRKNDPDGMRRRILDTAAELFQSRGYASTAMHDVAHEAGVTGGGMHHHFPTKKSLALAVINERIRPGVTETWLAPVLEAASVQEGVAQVFREIRDALTKAGRVRGCPLNNLALELSLMDPEIRVAISAIFAAWNTALVEKIATDQSKGRLTGHDPQRLATLIITAYSGAMTLAKVQQDPRPIDTCSAELLARMEP